ncbi:MAG: anaerobic ribonucleoside-triphosphate reductase activating protein [Bdellovibrionaceae bacterium]|nr:anaerobic ribonucleoside-triphosphate reductase activating protein [Pseudobdellovibrionaceae bacterium]
MRYLSARLVFQEVPDEISLALLITGCPMRCRGCHSSDAWNGGRGRELCAEDFDFWLARSRGALTCVLFLGGEWEPEALAAWLDEAHRRGLKTCLYTGLERAEVPEELVARLDYLKVGPYRADRGGLDSPRTNQRFYDISTGRDLTFRFHQEEFQGGKHDPA